MVDLAKLVVKLEAQTAQYMSAMEKAEKRLEKFDKQATVSVGNIAKGVAAAALAAAAGLAAMGKSAIDNADQLDKVSQSSGISVESLSQLQYAAEISNLSFEELSKATAKFSKTAADAARGSDKAADAFEALGIKVTNSDGSLRGTEELLLDVADRFSKMEDGAAKAALAQDLFSKSGARLIPFLNEGRAGIEKLKQEADAFGLTVSGKSAKAADAFNDNLDRLKAASKGVVNQFIEGVLPMLLALTERFVKSAKSGGALELAVKSLSAVFKTFVSAGVIVTSVFEQLGRIVYGVGAAILRVAQGDFSLAVDEITDAFGDARNNVAEDMETIAKVWSDTVPEIQAAAEGMDDALEDTIIFSDKKAGDKARKAAESALESIQSLALGVQQQVDTYGLGEAATIRYRIAHGDLKDTIEKAGAAAIPYIDQLVQMTDQMEALKKRTEEEVEQQRQWDALVEEGKRVAEAVRTPAEDYAATIERLNMLLEKGVINQETYNLAVEDAQDAFDKAMKGENKFLEQATRNTQDVLADGLETAIDDGVKAGGEKALTTFADMLQKMALQALAAQLAAKLFGDGGVGSGGGWVGAAMSFFGGTKDSGGRGRPGMAYAIGTGAQPEMFVPDTAGTFVPRDQWMGGGQTVVQNFNIEAPKGTVSRSTQMQIASNAAKSLQSANRRNN